jgi:hypothetical protein
MRASGFALAAAALVAALPASADTDWTPITFRQVSYTRPFVPVRLNGQLFLFMVHAQAGFYLQTNHANAAAAKVTLSGPKTSYGIERSGKVSALGRSAGTVGTLSVGRDKVANAPATIFETPQDFEDGRGMDGMLGMLWLRARRVIVDYDRYRIGIPDTPADAEAERAALLARGYVAHRLAWDEERREYHVAALVGGKPARLAISTVGITNLDKRFADSSGIALGPVVNVEGGPGGALVDAYLVKRPLVVTIEGQALAPIQPQSWNRDAYASRTTRSPDDGALGADFMLANQAVIDFGTGWLYLRS